MSALSERVDHSPTPGDESLDIDVGGFARAVVRRWWLVLVLVLVGATTGLVWWYVQPAVYEATAAVYLGQPTDVNGNAIVGVNSNPKAAAAIVAGSEVVQEAAAAVPDGMSAKQIRANLKIETPTVTAKTTSAPTNYVAITVSGGSAEKTAAAANALAAALVTRLSDYAEQKTQLLEARLAADKVRLKTVTARLDTAQTLLDRVVAGSAPAVDKAVAAAPYLTVVQAAGEQKSELESQIARDELALMVVTEVESPRVISSAVPADERSRSSIWLAIGAGAIAGLAVGLVVVAVLMRRDRVAA